MEKILSVIIGIQARTTSTRFPGKVLEAIGGKRMIDHVIDTANQASEYMNRYTSNTKVLVSSMLLVPTGDVLESDLRIKGRISVVSGSEDDVLGRYHDGILKDRNPDYIVRVTSDCPLLPSHVIVKAIKIALMNTYDFVSNCDPETRTTPNGWDVEVFSRRLLEYAHKYAMDPSDREHVTTFMRRDPPGWATQGNIIGFIDLSHLKISVDTAEDLEHVRTMNDRTRNSFFKSRDKYGPKNTHRY